MHAGFSSFIQLLCGARFRGKGTSDLTHCIHSGRGGTKSLDKRKGIKREMEHFADIKAPWPHY